MADSDPNKPFQDAVSNLRDTTKWILSSAAGLGALLVGGSSLSGIASIADSPRLVWAIGSSVVGIVMIVLVIVAAVSVLASTTGINFRDLVIEPRFKRYRDFLETNVMVGFPDEYRTVETLDEKYRDTQRLAQAGNEEAAAAMPVYIATVAVVLAAARWLHVALRFRCLLWVFAVSLGVLLGCVYVFVWAINPSKDIGTELETPLLKSVDFPPAALSKLASSGWPQTCAKPPVAVMIVRERAANIVEAYTIPTAACPARKVVFATDTLFVLSVR